MSIEWTDEAVSAALRKYHDSCGSMSLEDAMRAALDAAVKAQGFEVMLWKKRKDVRAEAFEEAAKYLDSIHHKSTAELIRNLAKEGK
jgi:uncharacterized glyoxalase superfamily protein PhnB